MFQGIVLLALGVGAAGMGVHMLANPEEASRRRARARGWPTRGRPSPEEIRSARMFGVAFLVVGLVAAIGAIVLTTQMASLQQDMRDLDDQQQQISPPRTGLAMLV